MILLVSVLNVVPTPSPDPGRLQVLGSAGPAAAAAGELAVPAAPGHAVDHPGARHGVGEGRLLRGWKQERRVRVVERGAFLSNYRNFTND